MNYIQYTFTVSPPEPGSDILIALLADMGFESFATTASGFDAFVQQEAEDTEGIRGLTFDDFTFTFERHEIPAQNWNDTWEKSFSPVYVEGLCCIRAHFHEKPEGVMHDIIITPKMSFGTGHHDTTWLMCKTLFSLPVKGTSVLDMGCGTGVLAILASQLGATRIEGIDIDESSIENSIENAEVNGCNNIRFRKGDAALLTEPEAYEIILANINKNVLKKDLPAYFASMKPGGYLLLSGFFTVDVEELKGVAEKAGFSFMDAYARNEWAVMKLQHRVGAERLSL